MKKKWLYLLFASGFLGMNTWAQQGESIYLKCSPQTSILLDQYKTNVLTSSSLQSLTGSSSKRVGVFFKVATADGWNLLKKAGAEVYPINKEIGTAYLHLEQLEGVVNSPLMKFVEVSTPTRLSMDKARSVKHSNADKAISGEGLTMPYRGKGVIVGVVDVGFDFTHPTLYDLEGKEYRVSWGWDQGTSPIEVKRLSPDELQNKQHSYDSKTEQHGTHVVGIAAGSGYGTTDITANNYGYCGVAPESEICLVATTLQNTDIVKGVGEIFSYADEVQKPCVVNLSLGSASGPHDGSDLFSESISAMTGKGHIVVAAAGNEGAQQGYLGLGSNGGKKYTFVEMNQGKNNCLVELWGAEEDSDFSVSIDVYNTIDHKLRGESEPVSVSSLIGENKNMRVTLPGNVKVLLSGGLYEGNNKYNMVLNFNTEGLKKGDVYQLAFSSKEAGVHVRAVFNCFFSKTGANSGKIQKGKTDHSTGAPAEGKEIIAVGNYVTRTSFTNVDDESLMFPGTTVSEIASSSSYGPTYDGRLCPIVSAPGSGIASSYNKYYVQNHINDQNVKALIMADTNFKDEIYPWGLMTGTSMASPYVCGTIALWLQADPTLTPEDIRSVLSRTSRSDDFTDECPNNRWGYGKIDSYKGLLEVMKLPTANGNIFTERPEEAVSVYVTEEGEINVRWAETPEQFSVNVFDISGRMICRQDVEAAVGEEYTVPVALMHSGIYIIKIDTEKGTVTRKIKF